MILDTIAQAARERVEIAKQSVPLEKIQEQIQQLPPVPPFRLETAIKAATDIAFICEVKKASPSKGVIAESFPYCDIALEYEAAGATAISCLTEPRWFLGRDEYLSQIAQCVQIPVLRKDFTVDPYQIYQAKLLGASAVLLICALLDRNTLIQYKEIADSLGLSALIEAHTEEEVKLAVDIGARIIGVNNRDLKTFKVDITTSVRLRKFVPADILFVSESGISTPNDIQQLRENGTNAVLIGESFMTSPDKKQQMIKLRSGGAKS